MIAKSTTPESINRSIHRISEPSREVNSLLRSLRESRAFWCALRKHETRHQCEQWLRAVVGHKEYLRLWTEVRFFDPDFVDEEIKKTSESCRHCGSAARTQPRSVK